MLQLYRWVGTYGCCMHIKAFKRRAGLGYIQTVSVHKIQVLAIATTKELKNNTILNLLRKRL